KPGDGGELPLRSVWEHDFKQRWTGGSKRLSLQFQGESRQQRAVLLRLPLLCPESPTVAKPRSNWRHRLPGVAGQRQFRLYGTFRAKSIHLRTKQSIYAL